MGMSLGLNETQKSPYGRFSIRIDPTYSVGDVIKHLQSHNLHILKHPSYDRVTGVPTGDNLYIVSGYGDAMKEASCSPLVEYYLYLGA
jgi:hypothetical protein